MNSDKLYTLYIRINYAIACLLWTFALRTIPNPIIVANIEEPPYDIIGSGDPTIGNKPSTIDRLTVI